MNTRERKVLITLLLDNVAPRFDLTSGLLVARVGPDAEITSRTTVVLPETSGESLCHMILEDNIGHVICSGIEEELYQYLRWKKVEVFDSVIGPAEIALWRFAKGRLAPGDILSAGD